MFLKDLHIFSIIKTSSICSYVLFPNGGQVLRSNHAVSLALGLNGINKTQSFQGEYLDAGFKEIQTKNYLYSEHSKSWALSSLCSLHKTYHVTAMTIISVDCNNYNYYTNEDITTPKMKELTRMS